MPTIAPGLQPLGSDFSLCIDSARKQPLEYDASNVKIQRIPCPLDIKPADIKCERRAAIRGSDGVINKRRLRGAMTKNIVLAAVRAAGEPLTRHEVEARLVGQVGEETIKWCVRELTEQGKLVVTREKRPGATRKMNCYAIGFVEEVL